jgi:hypothetical protein
MTTTPEAPQRWDSRRTATADRLRAGAAHSDGKVIKPAQLKDLLQAMIRSGDRVALEGDNQKQADFLSRSEHLDLFERGIATKLDLAYAGPRSVRVAQVVEDGTRLMSELGMTRAIEIQPGHVLTRLLHSAAPNVVSISLQDDRFAAATARRLTGAQTLVHQRRLDLRGNGNIGRTDSVAGMPITEGEDPDGH